MGIKKITIEYDDDKDDSGLRELITILEKQLNKPLVNWTYPNNNGWTSDGTTFSVNKTIGVCYSCGGRLTSDHICYMR
jgi:hypothetical protein